MAGAIIAGVTAAAFGLPWIPYAVSALLSGYLQRRQAKKGQRNEALTLQITAPAKGQVLPVVYGKARTAGCVIWYGNFHSQPEDTGKKGGGGGSGGKGSSEPATYSSSFAVSLSEGPIKASPFRVWMGNDEVDLTEIVYTLHTGELGQAADAHIAAHLDAGQVSLNYPGIAYIVFQDWNFGYAPVMPNFTFEVTRGLAEVVASNPSFPAYMQVYSEDANGDMNPVAILADLVTNTRYGLGLPQERIHEESFVAAAQWCLDNGLYCSPILVDGDSGLSHIEHILTYFDGILTHSQGKLKLFYRGPVYSDVALHHAVDTTVFPAVAYADWNITEHRSVLAPSTWWRALRRELLIKDIPAADAVAREAGNDWFWCLDKDRGVMTRWDAITWTATMLRLLPAAVGAVAGIASSSLGGNVPANAFDGNPVTFWQAGNNTIPQWIQGTVGAATDIDSVQVAWTEGAGGAAVQPYIRGVRIDPADHDDPAQTTVAIVNALIATMLAHGLNRAYVFAAKPDGFYWNTGTVDYIPYGSDGGDFLVTFAAAATAAGIETYGSCYFLRNLAHWEMNPAQRMVQSDGTDYWFTGFDNGWLCYSRPGVAAWWNGILASLLVVPNLDGVDIAEPQWGWAWGNSTCWCDDCKAAFAAAHPGAVFGEQDAREGAAISTWEQWRADVLTGAISVTCAAVTAATLTSNIVSVLDVRHSQWLGEVQRIENKLKFNGLDWDGILNDANPPDEATNQCTWQEKAGYNRDYITFSPEWTEYATRWWLSFVDGRATAVIHIGIYHTDDVSGSNWNYGYDHLLTAAEVQRAYEAAMRGGALHIESYSLASIINEGLWAGVDAAYAGLVYNSILGEVQRWDGAAWRPAGRRAWFRTRSSALGYGPAENPHLCQFDRLSTDRFRVHLYPAPNGDRILQLNEIEFRRHAIQSATNIWGGFAYDNFHGSLDLWLVNWTPALAQLYRIDDTTGLNVAPSPYALPIGVQGNNDLTFTPIAGRETIILSQGYALPAPGEPAVIHLFNSPATLVGTEYPNFDGTTGYLGLCYDPLGPWLVVNVNQVGRGARLWWLTPATRAPDGSYADHEIALMWGGAMEYANDAQRSYLWTEYNYSTYALRRCTRMTDGAAPSAIASSVGFAAATVDCDVELAEALRIPQTSLVEVKRFRAAVVVGADGGNTFGEPTIEVFTGDAHDPPVWTTQGMMAYDPGVGTLRLATLELAVPYAECRRVRFRFTRPPGATHIGVVELWVLTMGTEIEITAADYVEDKAPVLARQGERDTINTVRIEWRDRENIYSQAVAERKDDRSVRETGERALQLDLPGIVESTVADALASKLLHERTWEQISVSVGLGPQHLLLEPGDMIEFNDPDYHLDEFRARIVSIQESKDEILEVTAAEER